DRGDAARASRGLGEGLRSADAGEGLGRSVRRSQVPARSVLPGIGASSRHLPPFVRNESVGSVLARPRGSSGRDRDERTAPMSTEQAITPPDGAPSSTEETVDDAVFYEDEVEPEYGILGFTLRELVILGAWALAFIVSFFPVHSGGPSVWTSGIDWILA